jgi:hypothetical protein
MARDGVTAAEENGESRAAWRRMRRRRRQGPANPAFRANELFVSFEDMRSRRFPELRRRFGIDRAVRGGKDEFRRILLLRHWIKGQMRIHDYNPNACRGDAFVILAEARRGEGFDCEHFMKVQEAVMNAYGYVARCLGTGYGGSGPHEGGHHGVNEVWSNQYGKWFLSDAKYDWHFEKKGIPLSALEIRDEILKNKAKDVVRVVGPERRKARDGKNWGSVKIYRWISWELQGNRVSIEPLFHSSALVLYDDAYSRRNTWYRGGRDTGGRPHWAYASDYFIRVPHRGWIEWTPNVVDVHLHRDGDRAKGFILSCTPGFKEYRMRELPRGRWKRVNARFDLRLGGGKRRIEFCSVNVAGVCGPPFAVTVG